MPRSKHLCINGTRVPVLDMPILPAWTSTAREKGFDIAARVRDRFHLALRCDDCDDLNLVKIFTLRTARPSCSACQNTEHHSVAEAAGLTFLHRCPDHRHYAFYQLPCGHRVRRQFGRVQRVAAEEAHIRCETCFNDRLASEAAGRGWKMIGNCFPKRLGYRRYEHDCGHRQDIATINMKTGRFNCAGCGDGWSSGPSFIYLMRFTSAAGRIFLKLGFSRDPDSRLTYQLVRSSSIRGEILDQVPVRSGHRAMQIEKRWHNALRKRFPEAVVPAAAFTGDLAVRSEIYEPHLEPDLRRRLADLRLTEASACPFSPSASSLDQE